MRGLLALSTLLVVLALATCGGEERPSAPFAPATEAGRAEHFALVRVAEGLVRPTWVGVAPGDRGALWVAEQPGRVIRLSGRGRGERRRVVVDLRREVTLGAEQGLLGLAFHPDFARNRRLYLHWSDRRGDTRVAELRVRRTGRSGARRRELLHVEQPEENHKGGQLLFGPDGRLYLGLGDGGGAFDPQDRAQDLDSKLGKLLAADVDLRGPTRWEIVLSGLRNPWRFSFDTALNEVWIGDVGQDSLEEVNRVALELDEPPKNLGWPAYEGDRALQGRRLDRTGALILPVAAYPTRAGCSITGGLVYRGARLPSLAGRYVYGDFCTGALWTLDPTPDGRARDVRRERAAAPQLTHIGADLDGELLLATASGELHRATAPRVRRP